MNIDTKILKEISSNNFNVSESIKPMTKTIINNETVLKAVLQEVMTKSVKETKNQITDIAKLNNACTPYINEQISKGSNIKWTISEIQNMMKEKVEYSPKNKEDSTYSSPFEMRVLASAEQIVLVLERINPYAFGEYDAKGNWKDHDATVKTTNEKNYNVKFNDVENGFDFDKDGNLEIANRYIKPVIENEVKVSDNVTKKERFVNQTDTKQQVSKAIATGFFNRAYPQAKKKRKPNPLSESHHIENAEKLNKFVNDINVIYSEYVKSGGKHGSSERLSETDAKVLMTLKDNINTMLSTRGNAEDLAFEIEKGITRKAL